MELKRVVVTGMGTINPLGNNITDYWENLKKGVSGCDTITRFDTTKFRTKFACEIIGYNSLDYFDRKTSRRMDLFTQYAIVTAEEAIQTSKIDLETADTKRIGVIFGVGIGGMETLINEVSSYGRGDGTPHFTPFFIPKLIANIAGGHISIKYGFKGPNFTTVSACTSSAHALIDAYNYIRLGKADIILAGGSEAAINQAGIGGFNAMRALSVRNDDPSTASRPFDVDRDGFVLGEGAGIIVLEDYEHALKRGANIYAEVAGCGLNGDAYHITAPHPEGDGAADVMRLAIEDANVAKEKVDYINVHGTSTGLGDIAEVKAIQKVFNEHAYKLNISSTKSMTGHLLGAAGVVESMAAIFAVRDDIVPPTINHFNLDPKIDSRLNFTFNKMQKRKVDYALSNTFGFGGHNASVMFKKYTA